MTTSLLSRLQSLTGPSREIDAEIALANGWTKCETDEDYDIWCPPDHGVTRQYTEPPRYTESFDAALTLKRKGMVAVLRCLDAPEQFDCPRRIFVCSLFMPDDPGDRAVYTGIAPNAAIALLIPITKAKEESGK